MSHSFIPTPGNLVVEFFSAPAYVIDPSIADVFIYTGAGGESTILPLANKPVYVKNGGSGTLNVRYNSGNRIDTGFLMLEPVPINPETFASHGVLLIYNTDEDRFYVLTSAEVVIFPEG